MYKSVETVPLKEGRPIICKMNYTFSIAGQLIQRGPHFCLVSLTPKCVHQTVLVSPSLFPPVSKVADSILLHAPSQLYSGLYIISSLVYFTLGALLACLLSTLHSLSATVYLSLSYTKSQYMYTDFYALKVSNTLSNFTTQYKSIGISLQWLSLIIVV